MITIQYDWKPYRVYLQDLHAWLQTNSAGYCGMSANSKLELHFTEAPDEAAIAAKWEELTEESEAAKWAHSEALAAAEAKAREDVLTMSWDEMSPAQRKIAMNRPLTNEDREALLGA